MGVGVGASLEEDAVDSPTSTAEAPKIPPGSLNGGAEEKTLGEASLKTWQFKNTTLDLGRVDDS